MLTSRSTVPDIKQGKCFPVVFYKNKIVNLLEACVCECVCSLWLILWTTVRCHIVTTLGLPEKGIDYLIRSLFEAPKSERLAEPGSVNLIRTVDNKPWRKTIELWSQYLSVAQSSSTVLTKGATLRSQGFWNQGQTQNPEEKNRRVGVVCVCEREFKSCM